MERARLTLLLPRLVGRGDARFAVGHPSDEIGEPLTVAGNDNVTTEFTSGVEEDAAARAGIGHALTR